MKARILGTARQLVNRLGYEVSRRETGEGEDPIESTQRHREIWEIVRPYTMTSRLRVMALLQAVDYVQGNDIQGDFVECGVWRGGSAMAMALSLIDHLDETRSIWLYDTFAGMPTPSQFDRDHRGRDAAERAASLTRPDGGSNWCYAGLGDVKANLYGTGFPVERMVFIEGDVAVTLRERAPEQISLLRLDTDWYESTKAELEILFPRLSKGGICIIDDYGHWRGARQAVDEYFAALGRRPLLQRIDYTGRLIVKVH